MARMSLKQALKRKMTPAEKARLDALTNRQTNAAARSDPDNPPLTPKELAGMRAIVRSRDRPAMPKEERKVSLTLRRAAGPRAALSFLGTGLADSETLQHATLRAAGKQSRKPGRAASKRRYDG